MYWKDEGYLLHKNNFDENSIIIEVFTLNHGKYKGIVYGGLSKKLKNNFQIGNKILLNFKAKNENRMGYFNVELIRPVVPFFFDDRKRSICILAASTILKVLLPERQINSKIYYSFQRMVDQITINNWIYMYILWELSLIKELGYELNFNDKTSSKDMNFNIEINGKKFKVPKLLLYDKLTNLKNDEIKEALIFTKNLLMENFTIPNHLQFPISRNVLEKYFN